MILPWMGSIPYATLRGCFGLLLAEELGIHNVTGRSPYFMIVKTANLSIAQLYEAIDYLRDATIIPEDLVPNDEDPMSAKFDRFLPGILLRKTFAYDSLDLEEMKSLLAEW